jgi:Sigma-70 region 2
MRAGGSATCKVSAERLHEEEFDELRPSAFAIAYRMLSSVSEAEDTVQEGFFACIAARQLVSRARRHVEERRPRFEVSRDQRGQLAARFFAAAEGGNLEGLEELLAHDVVLHADGGGKAPTVARGIHGRVRVARTLIAGLRTATCAGGFTFRREEVNGQPGALFFDPEGRVGGVMVLDVADGQIQGLSSINNPDKLRHLGPVADLRALLRKRSRPLSTRGLKQASSRPATGPR